MKKTLDLLRRVLAETVWIALTGAVVVGGYQGFQYLKTNRAVVEFAPTERPVSAVDTVAAEAWTAPLPIRGEGFVAPLRSVALSAQSGGMIADLHPAITREAGNFREGDVLVQLDDSAERANLRQTRANIASAETQLSLEQSKLARVKALFDRGAASQQALDEAEARAAEAQARLDGFVAGEAVIEVALENKIVRAPFDGAILSKSAEVGSIVGAGQEIAEAFTDGQLIVDVNVSEAEAALIPGLFDGATPHAEVHLAFAGEIHAIDGKVTRVDPAIDPRTRTLTVTVALDRGSAPRAKDGNAPAAGAPPALVNAFTRVVIDGLTGDNIYRLPSTALHAGEVWLLVDGQLRIVPARPLHIDGEETYAEIRALPAGARIVTSTIAAPVDGMALRDLASANGEIEQAALAGEE